MSAKKIDMAEFVTVDGVPLSDMPASEARAWVSWFERNSALLDKMLAGRSDAETANDAVEAAMNDPKFASVDWSDFQVWYKEFLSAPWIPKRPL